MLRTGELANDVGTVLVGEEAVENGLIDQVGIKRCFDKIKGTNLLNKEGEDNDYIFYSPKRNDLPQDESESRAS